MQRTVSLEQELHPGTEHSKVCTKCNLEKRSLSTANLKLGDVIGFGSFSTVHEGTSDGRNVAVKKIRIPDRDPVVLKRMQREIHILAAVDHPNIVKLVDVFHDDAEGVVSIVLDRCMGGELFDFVNDFQTFHGNGERSWLRSNTTELHLVREEHIARIIQQILLAVEHLHERNIVHRDLKLENVMLEEPFTTEREPQVKLIDFGFSRDHGGHRDMFTACGSTLYIAPEVLTAKESKVGYGRECDLWAVGVMAFILLCCKPPFMGPTSYDIGCAIKAGKYTYPEYALVSPEAKHLISRLLEMDPLKRLTASQALQHPWIRKYCPEPAPRAVTSATAKPKTSSASSFFFASTRPSSKPCASTTTTSSTTADASSKTSAAAGGGGGWGSRLGFPPWQELLLGRWLRSIVPAWLPTDMTHARTPPASPQPQASTIHVT